MAMIGCGGGGGSSGSSVDDPPPASYSISGTVRSAAYLVTDSDVNDPNTTPVTNNTFDQAQTISAPVTVSGYVNVAGAGEDGNSRIAGDPNDYYLVALTRGTIVTLVMTEDPAFADLNLYLYDDRRTLIDASLTPGDAIDTLTVAEDGSYYVRVEAVADTAVRTATVYALSIGRTGSPAARSALRLGDDFVPGEALVRFEAGATEGTVAALAGHGGEVSAMGFSSPAGAVGAERLLRCAGGVHQGSFLDTLEIRQPLERSLAPAPMDGPTRAKLETLWMVRRLRQQPGIRHAEPNYIRKPLAVPNDPYYPYQWHYPLINLPEAWDITTASANVVVAVVDTGVLLAHPDLQGQLVDGYDFISDPAIALDGDGVDTNPDDPGDQGTVNGSTFHGTHVAGTIAAAANNAIGGAGVAWNARIMPLRALGFGGGTNYDLLQAVKYAAGLATDYPGVRLARAVDVINLSLGGSGFSQIEADVYRQVRQQGVIVIAAAGNAGTTEKSYPAAYEGVVSVSAVTIDETLAPYSNRGETIDVAAPGGASNDANGDGYMDGVLSTSGNDGGEKIQMGYAFSIGTSMAAPHVSGVVALMKALYPGLKPAQFDALLAGGFLTRDLGDTGRDNQFGHGLIDAYKAVLMAWEGASNGGIPAILSVSPGNLNFGPILTQAVVTLSNGGNPSEPLSITGFSVDAPWLAVQAEQTDADGLGTYVVAVNRTGLTDGVHTGAVTFESSANRVTVAVSLRVGMPAEASDAGYHYVLLVDADSKETRGQVGRAGTGGSYTYRFSGLAAGDRLVIYAGTDADNDGFICDNGEACGAYLSLDQPLVLTVAGDRPGIDFSTDINLNLFSVTDRFGVGGLPLQREGFKEVIK